MAISSLPLRQPGLHFGVFVGAVVIHNQMQIELPGHLYVDAPQEAHELLVPCLGLPSAITAATVATRSRLRPLQDLNLRLLVNAAHDSVLGWIQVLAENVASLSAKNGSVDNL